MLDVGSLFVLVFTQVLSICYLYLDNLQSLPSGLDHEGIETTITIMLFVANIAVAVVLVIAWIGRLAYEKFTATKRKVNEAARTRAESARGSAIEMSTPPGRLHRTPQPERALDETWEEIEIRAPNIELVWVDAADGVTIVDAPDGIVVKWQNAQSGVIVAPNLCRGLVPPMEFDLAICDATTDDLAAVDAERTPAWRNTATGAFVELDDVRPCTMWLNHRTDALSRVNPHAKVVGNELVPPPRIADAGAAVAAAGAASAADEDGPIDAFVEVAENEVVPPPRIADAGAAVAAVAADEDSFEPPPPLDVNADGPIDAFAPPPLLPGGGGPPLPTPAPFAIDMVTRQGVVNPARAALRERDSIAI